MDSLLLDLRFALRSLRRRPTFAVVAVATIALSIGAATSIFSVVDGVLFRSLPYRDAGRLVAVWQTYPSWKKEPILAPMWDRINLSYPDFLLWRKKQTSFDAVGVSSGYAAIIPGPNGNDRLVGLRVSADLFEALHVTPAMGRTFLPGEDVAGGPHVTVLSHELWMSRYGARRDILGQHIIFNDAPYQIVGVLPPGFVIDRGSAPPPFFIPTGQEPNDLRADNHGFNAIARLKPGVTLEQAYTETDQLLRHPEQPGERGLRVENFQRDQTRDVRAPLLILLGAVGLLLLIAIVNVATLLLGEAAGRAQELGTRVALGASRTRLVRQLLTESVLLAAVGSTLGVLLAWLQTKIIVALAPSRIPGIQSVHVDGRVLVVALALATITGVLFGLAPALALSGAGGAATLRGGGQSAAGRGRLQRTLIATELALSVVLLVGAGLLTRSLLKLTSVDPGFRTNHLLAVRIGVPRAAFRDSVGLRAFYDAALIRLAALPGVSATTAVNMVPFSGGSSSSSIVLAGEDTTGKSARSHTMQQRNIVPNYFAALGIPLLSGRAFSPEDRVGAELVVIVSESAARRDWPTSSPLGTRVRFQGLWRTVVGVVADTKYKQLSTADAATIYAPVAQELSSMTFIVRTRGDPATASLLASIRAIVRELAPAMVVSGADTMDELIKRSLGEERFRTALIALFGAMAALLAAVGMYGVTARAVSRRTREVGIRVALGATPASVIALMVRHSLSGMMIGIAAGVAGAFVASRVLAPYLYGVKTYDPATYAGIFGLLAVVIIAGSWLPARRAGRVEPAIVLRGE